MQSFLQRLLYIVVLVFLAVNLFGQTNVAPAAGTGTAGLSGDGGAATAALLNGPTDVAIDSAGNVYIADRNNNRIRKLISADGTITTAAGNGDPNLWYLEGGPAATSVLNHPFGTATDAAGNWYIADFGGFSTVNFTNLYVNDEQSSGATRIHKVNPAGTTSLIHVPTDLNGVLAIAVDAAGNLYIAERLAQRIYKFSQQTNTLTPVAGTGTAGFSGDGGAATAAQIHNPAHIAIDSAGNLYFSDAGNNRIRKVAARTGIITTVAGSGAAGISGDGGPATSAQLNDPEGVTVDSAGNLFIADTGNNRIRRVSASSGLITTLIGVQANADCASAAAPSLQSPESVVVNATGDTLYIADDAGNRVWRADLGIKPPKPTLASIAPASGAAAATVTVTLTGTGFGTPAGSCQVNTVAVAVSGTGVTASNVNVTSDTSLTAVFTIAADAQGGVHNVTVANDTGASSPVQFTVTGAKAAQPPPQLTSISPSSGGQGSSLTVTLTGTNFVTGAGNTTISSDGTGVSFTQITVGSATSLTAVLSIAPDAPLGQRNLQVTTPAGPSNSVAFTVVPLNPTFVYNMPSVLNPTDQTPVQLALASPFSNSVTGTLNMAFTPNATVGIDDPNATLVSADASTRSTDVSFPANTSTAHLSLSNGVLQAGTVAGTIELTVSNVEVGGNNVTATGTTFDVQVPRLPPVITNIRILNRTSSAFEVEVTGYSTPRDITGATFDFTAATGQKLLTLELKPGVTGTFTSYYQSPPSDPVGSAFVYTQPFIIKQGTANAVASVAVTLSNSAGTSDPATVQ